MRESRTHFEQIPLEVVKKIAEGSVFKNQKASTVNVIPERSSIRRKPRTVPARPRARKRR